MKLMNREEVVTKLAARSQAAIGALLIAAEEIEELNWLRANQHMTEERYRAALAPWYEILAALYRAKAIPEYQVSTDTKEDAIRFEGFQVKFDKSLAKEGRKP